MRMYDLIYTKKTGGALSAEQIAFWVKGVAEGSIPDEQSAALLMAVCWRGMSTEETLALTLAMRDSGARMDLSAVPGLKVDKHSTGGVGDKTTLILGPIVAACGVPCAMFSGRGLGHTGGTIDKFSAVPGLNVELSADQFRESLRRTGFANSAQTADICPADRKLYALRDVTATVESIPLITASIMSKKLAGGADALVLDVKCGTGAFMKTLDDARALARSMVAVGKAHGMRIKALLTRMEEPLGWAIGNALEVIESVEILQGRHADGVLARMSFRLAAEMLVLGRAAGDLQEAERKVAQVVADGSALRLLGDFVRLNGGDARALEDFSRLPQAGAVTEVRADRGGYVHAMDSRALGILAMELGAGRRSKDDRLDLGAGIRVHRNVGDAVRAGDPLFSVYARVGLPVQAAAFLATTEILPEPASVQPWLLEEIG
jgi:pyrimidine-nucleoside phosphorylase